MTQFVSNYSSEFPATNNMNLNNYEGNGVYTLRFNDLTYEYSLKADVNCSNTWDGTVKKSRFRLALVFSAFVRLWSFALVATTL